MKSFLQQGSFPLFNGTELCGAICIDPSKLSPLLKFRSRRLIKVTSYGRLLSYTTPLINQINSKHQKTVTNEENSKGASPKELPAGRLRQVFQLIATEAQAFKSDRCIISEKKSCLVYQLATPEDEIAEGVISADVSSTLIEFLTSCLTEKRSVFIINGKSVFLTKKNTSFILSFNEFQPKTEEDKELNNLILVLEDDQIFAKVTGLLLQDHGYLHEVTSNPFEAIARLRSLNTPPLAILCDLQLAQGSGLEFIHTLRNDPQLKYLNVIALTSTDDPLPPLRAGADIFIRKSDGPEILIAYLSRLQARELCSAALSPQR